MSVCPNCGAMSNGGKFCENCGTALPVEQPVQPAQPVQSQPVQPVYQQPAQQVPVQPVYQQPAQPVQPVPVQPVYQQPVYQNPVNSQQVIKPVYQQPVYMQQPVQGYQASTDFKPRPVLNGACVAGFILGIVGLFTFGLTSLIGLIVSTVGVIVAFVKKQKGKVLGIIGIVLSLLLVIGWIVFIANADKISAALDEDSGGKSVEEWLFDEDYAGKIEMISETEWIEKYSGSCLIFEADDNFKYFRDYRDLTDYYYTGTYEIYFGYEAMDVIEDQYGQYGYTADDICDKIDNERGLSGVKQFMVLIIHNDGCWINGVNTYDMKWDNVYMGYYDDYRQIMDLTYLEDDMNYTFVAWDDFDESSIVMPDWDTTDVTELDDDFWGNDTVGYVELYQGEWEDCDEEDDMGYVYLDCIQKYDPDTETRIQMSVISGQYDPSLAYDMAEEFKYYMEDYGYSVSEVEETILSGYAGYKVTAQYESGEYLTAWYFVDEDLNMHYITVMYYDSDTVSYEMVSDTYFFENN